MTGGSAVTMASSRSGTLLGTPTNVAVWVIWHLLSAICIPLTLSEIRLNIALWDMSFPVRAFLVSLALTHICAAALLSVLALRRGTVGIPTVMLSVAVAYAGLFAALELSEIGELGYSRSVLGMAVGASFVLCSLALDLMQRLYKVLLPALLVASTGMVTVAFAGWPADDGVSNTAFYRVRLVESGLKVPSAIRGGALAVLGSGVLVASAEGHLYYVEGIGTPAGTVRRLRYEIPLDRDKYLADRPDNIYGNDPFRVTDIIADDLGDRVRLLAAHHYWNGEERCVGLRVSVTEFARDALLNETAELGWKRLYDSQPCLKLIEIRFEQDGGKMARLDDRTLLLTTGDHNLDGFSAKTSAPQDPQSHYGKTIRIDLHSGAAEIYTTGHRSPQGIVQTDDGRVWLTEQGPAGGDELNLLIQGSNYGWPRVTYGAAYDKHTWPPNARDGFHDGYVEPRFAWVPSIAASTILRIRGDLFPVWKGDLLVSSLKGHVIRLRVSGDRVVFAEHVVFTNTRIRDMVEAPDGRIILFQDDDGLISIIERAPAESEPTFSESPPPEGEALFRRCQDCHRIGTGSDHAVGPDLRGVVGRGIASASRFEYSAGLRSVDGSWTEERLHRFLQNPEGFAPGTSMRTPGIEDATTRKMLIDFLTTRR